MTAADPRARCEHCAAAFDPTTAKPAGLTSYDDPVFHSWAFLRCPECTGTVFWRKCGCTEREAYRLYREGGLCPRLTPEEVSRVRRMLANYQPIGDHPGFDEHGMLKERDA